MCTGTLSYKKSASTGISRDNLGAAERHHIAGEIGVCIFRVVKSQTYMWK